MKEVRLKNPTYRNCELYLQKKYKEINKNNLNDNIYPSFIFIVKDITAINSQVTEICNSPTSLDPMPLPIGHSFVLRSFISNDKTYTNYIQACSWAGDMYFVEKNNIEHVSN